MQDVTGGQPHTGERSRSDGVLLFRQAAQVLRCTALGHISIASVNLLRLRRI